MDNGIPRLLHYLDNFILVADSKQQAEDQKQILVSNCARLGVPLELSKLEGPSTCLTFLGIEVDLDLTIHSTWMIKEGKYTYMDKLVALDSCRPTQRLHQVRRDTGSPLKIQ